MPTFPTLTMLPSFPLDEEQEDVTIRTEMEAGYTHTRKRYTRTRITFTVKYDMITTSDKTTLEAFIGTVEQGGFSFSWTHPQSSVTHTVKFPEGGLPKFSHIITDYWSCEFKVRQV
jgi:hypothetical protein